MTPPGVETVRVELAERAYDVAVAHGLLNDLHARTTRALGAPPARAALIADAGLPRHTVQRAEASLREAGCAVTTIPITPSERGKSLATLETILRVLAATRHERRDPVIALGGGVVGDLAGFAAAVYRRGCPVVQCPTTLLAMVDAAVGGKTGVNLTPKAEQTSGEPELLKNFVGSFHQPALVLADVATLESLPERELRAGLAECLKHTLIAGTIDPDHGPAMSVRLDTLLPGVLAREPDACTAMVAANVRLKALVVAGDERELAPSAAGGRALLNLGHTFAHAIEPLAHLSPTGDDDDAPLRHGEAVAIGCVAAAATSAALGLADVAFAESVRARFEAAGLPTRLVGLGSDDDLLASMGHDKKVSGGKLRLVLPEPGALARVVESPPPDAVRAGWRAVRAG